jgi:lysyl-tRNA synthetase class 2
LRGFFAQRSLMEVDTPILAKTSVTDININSIEARVNNTQSYLQTSPEYFMKRLLAAGIGDIYYLGKVFRDGEQGPRHNPEFTLLEWYRLNWDEYQLMGEVAELITHLYQSQDQVEPQISNLSYAECFSGVFSIDPHSCQLEELQALAVDIGAESWAEETRANCLDLLFSERVEPHLPSGLVFVYDYPACQAALAQTKLCDDGTLVSRRFEAFLNRMELANGYFELTDAAQQRQRFETDNSIRSIMHKKQMPLDNNLHQAMQAGLPSCAGVALGVDRLLMQLYGIKSIDKVLAFDWERC